VDAINGSRVMVVIFSSNSNSSRQVIREVEQAVKRGVAILPLRIEDVPLSADMDYFISTLHWMDALSPPLEQHLVRLAGTIRLILSQPNDDTGNDSTPLPAAIRRTAQPIPDGHEATFDVAVTRKLEADLAWERIQGLDRSQKFGSLLDEAQSELRRAAEYDRRQVFAQAIEGYTKFILSCGRIEKHDQLRREAQAAFRKAKGAMMSADSSFTHEKRPKSFTHGWQALTEAESSYSEGQFDAAKKQLASAVERFTEAAAEAPLLNTFFDAEQVWLTELAAADKEILSKFAAPQFQIAMVKADDARSVKSAGQTEAATRNFCEAATTLAQALALAKSKERATLTAEITAQLEISIARRDKFGAEDLLAKLETLNSGETKPSSYRNSVSGLSAPLSIQLGGGVKMEFALLPAGPFLMGSEKGEANEKPVHQVTIEKSFYLGMYQVTQEQWCAIMGHNRSGSLGPRNPVDRVSWNDCQTFLCKLALKVPHMRVSLPTEALWEYACRAGSTSEYCYGDDPAGLSEYGWYSLNANSKSHPVGERKPNAWHLYDMHGNVWEWCADSFDAQYYAVSPEREPLGPDSASLRVLRGGSYYHKANTLRSAHRYWSNPSLGIPCYGFRVCAVPIQ
jgi:formylglycine-generating enzyme required for sulfatase activity